MRAYRAPIFGGRDYRAHEATSCGQVIFPNRCTILYSTAVIPFRVQFRPGSPLFEQIVYAAKKAVISGQIRPGDAFPSVRTLSRELKINPNTAHKVVTQIISEGLVETRPGL